jgi:hypothetical protein
VVAKVQSFIRRLSRRNEASSAVPVNQETLQAQAADFFNLPLAVVQQYYADYHALHTQKEYARRLGESKTLCFEEAFLLFVAAATVHPQHVVEIGTQYGKSTRRIVDMLQALHLNSAVTCFDVSNDIQYVNASEINLKIQDVTPNVTETVLSPLAPELIFLDARPYHLLKNVISEFLKWSLLHPSILAVHDCSPALYFPRMWISKDNYAEISTNTGVWERHVLSELFATENAKLDDVRTGTHRLRIFGTPHGLALIAPITLLDQVGEQRAEQL